jgi:hypothetical protein
VILERREQRAQRLFRPVALGLVQRPLDPLVSRGGQLAASERANVELFREAEPDARPASP